MHCRAWVQLGEQKCSACVSVPPVAWAGKGLACSARNIPPRTGHGWVSEGEKNQWGNWEGVVQDRVCKNRKKKWVMSLCGVTDGGERRCSNVGVLYMWRWRSKSFARMERTWADLSCHTYRNPRGKLIRASFISEWSGVFFNHWLALFNISFSVSKSKNSKMSCFLWRWRLRIVMKWCPISCRFVRLLQSHTSYTHIILECSALCVYDTWECSAVCAVPPGENLSWHLT